MARTVWTRWDYSKLSFQESGCKQEKMAFMYGIGNLIVYYNNKIKQGGGQCTLSNDPVYYILIRKKPSYNSAFLASIVIQIHISGL